MKRTGVSLPWLIIAGVGVMLLATGAASGPIAAAPAGGSEAEASSSGALNADSRELPASLPAQADRIGSLRLELARAGSEAALAGQSDLIVQAHPAGAASAHPTGRSAGSGGGKVLHYVQRLRVIETLKGKAPDELRLVLPGIEPLPPAKHPLNETYPGPLAEDEAYVLFLKPAGLPGLYTAVGGWQGIYPIGDEGHTIALAGLGFPELGGLTPAELRERLRAPAKRP